MTHHSVLLIENDQQIRRVVRLALPQDGFEIDEAGTGEEGLELLADRPFDAVCVDIMLPGRDGCYVCREIRRDSNVAIIMVAARGDSHDVVRSLGAGADDYVSKPFVVPELAARIRAVLRRVESSPPGNRVRVGNVEIAAHDGLVWREGRPLPLTRTEFRLVCELAAAPGRVFSREELLKQVWGYDYFGDNRLVDVHIGRLRRKIEIDPGHPKVVVTVRGLGYRLQT